MVTIPDVQPSPAWQDAWLGFELGMLARGRSPKTISGRHSTIMIHARRMTAQGTDPAGVTKALMQRYMVAQLAAISGKIDSRPVLSPARTRRTLVSSASSTSRSWARWSRDSGMGSFLTIRPTRRARAAVRLPRRGPSAVGSLCRVG
jgi:hypothetical protein